MMNTMAMTTRVTIMAGFEINCNASLLMSAAKWCRRRAVPWSVMTYPSFELLFVVSHCSNHTTWPGNAGRGHHHHRHNFFVEIPTPE
jgi:hypothetical protein